MLSVVVVTNRVGGLDALFAGLCEQTFQDFELLLIDELIERRGTLALDRGRLANTRTFCPRFAGRWGNYMASLNAALRAANGERLVFWSDFTAPSPGALQTHADFHVQNQDDILLAPIEYTELPRLHPGFPIRYGWLAMGHDVSRHTDDTYAPWLDDKRRHELYEEWRQNYEADLDSGRLDPFMWSCFEKPIESYADVANLRVFNHDRRDTSPFLNLKNDSIPRKWLEKIGGFDERADGCHGHQDSITWRALSRAGAKLCVRAENPVKLLDPHGLVLVRRFDAGKDDTSNLKIYEGAL